MFYGLDELKLAILVLKNVRRGQIGWILWLTDCICCVIGLKFITEVLYDGTLILPKRMKSFCILLSIFDRFSHTNASMRPNTTPCWLSVTCVPKLWSNHERSASSWVLSSFGVSFYYFNLKHMSHHQLSSPKRSVGGTFLKQTQLYRFNIFLSWKSGRLFRKRFVFSDLFSILKDLLPPVVLGFFQRNDSTNLVGRTRCESDSLLDVFIHCTNLEAQLTRFLTRGDSSSLRLSFLLTPELFFETTAGFHAALLLFSSGAIHLFSSTVILLNSPRKVL